MFVLYVENIAQLFNNFICLFVIFVFVKFYFYANIELFYMTKQTQNIYGSLIIDVLINTLQKEYLRSVRVMWTYKCTSN